MKRIAAIAILVASCATPVIPRDRERAALMATAPIREYLMSLRVDYVAGMPLCGGHMPDEVVLGCFYPDDRHIDIATIDWSQELSKKFRYESSMEETLAHEYGHALQLLMGEPMSHPVGTIRQVEAR